MLAIRDEGRRLDYAWNDAACFRGVSVLARVGAPVIVQLAIGDLPFCFFFIVIGIIYATFVILDCSYIMIMLAFELKN